MIVVHDTINLRSDSMQVNPLKPNIGFDTSTLLIPFEKQTKNSTHTLSLTQLSLSLSLSFSRALAVAVATLCKVGFLHMVRIKFFKFQSTQQCGLAVVAYSRGGRYEQQTEFRK